MKKYRFRLEKLLKYRKISEDKLKQELFRKMQILRECKNRLNLMKSEKQKSLEEFTQVQSNGINGGHLFIYKNYLNSLTEKVEEQKNKTVKSKREAEKVREDYTEARKELESIERFKEKDFQRYLKEVRISEQKMLDEVATNQYNAKNGKLVSGQEGKGVKR